MPRERRTLKKPSPEELQSLQNLAENPRLETRVNAVLMISSGASVDEAASKVGVSSATVHRWLDAYEKNGSEGLRDRRRSGLRKKLSPEEIQEMDVLVSNGVNAGAIAKDYRVSEKQVLDYITQYRLEGRTQVDIDVELRGVLFRPVAFRLESVLVLGRHVLFAISSTASTEPEVITDRNIGLKGEKGPLNRALVQYLRQVEDIYPVTDSAEEMVHQLNLLYRRCTHAHLEIFLFNPAKAADPRVSAWFSSKRKANLIIYNRRSDWEREFSRWLVRLGEPEAIQNYWDTPEDMAKYVILKLREFTDSGKTGFAW